MAAYAHLSDFEPQQYQNFNSTIGVGPFNNYSIYNHHHPPTSHPNPSLVKLFKGPPTTSDGGGWQYKQEQQDNLFNNHMPYAFGNMETEGVLNPLNVDVVVAGPDYKSEAKENNNSSPCSPSVDGQTNENCAKGGKVDPKVCGVCGDKALGNNFNAITCESCKAFFRRNALKHKDFVCPFNDNCNVDPITRRFCQKCRLKKCMDIGMKKEWIMTEEEKKMKKQKIEQNRLKRQSSDVAPSGNEGPLAKTSCVIREDQSESNSSVHESVITLVEDHWRHHQPESAAVIPVLVHHDEQARLIPNGHEEHYVIQRIPREHISYDNSSNSSEAMGPIQSHLHHNFREDQAAHHLYTKMSNKGHDGVLVSLNNSVEAATPSHRLRSNLTGGNIVWQGEGDVSSDCPSGKIPSHPPSHTMNPIKARMYGMHPNSHLNGNAEVIQSTPLLSSLIRPGLAESPPDADLVDCSTSNIILPHSPANSMDQEYTTPLHGNDNGMNHPELSRIHPSGHGHLREGSYLTASTSGGHYSNPNGSPNAEEETIPLPLNNLDSILSVAITAEYNSFRMNGSQTRELNKAERAKLNELRNASQALHAPVDAEGPLKLSETSDPSLINVINLTDIAIRRLIQMSKKIASFKNMCQEDQIALLKGSCTEMMILRSAVSYDPDRDSWNIPHSFGCNIKLGVLKEARGNLYEEHQRFVRSFKPIWRSDENIMIILCAITLFTAERPNVVHKDVVKLEQDSYYYLLKRYLESTLNGCEARSTYLQLIKKIAELHELNSNHLRVFLEVNPREVEPLLIEIFDLKQ